MNRLWPASLLLLAKPRRNYFDHHLQECLVEEEEKERRLKASHDTTEPYPMPSHPDPSNPILAPVSDITSYDDKKRSLDALNTLEETTATFVSIAAGNQQKTDVVDNRQDTASAPQGVHVEKLTQSNQRIHLKLSLASHQGAEKPVKRTRARYATEIPSPFGIVEEPMDLISKDSVDKHSTVEITDVTDLLSETEPVAAAVEAVEVSGIIIDEPSFDEVEGDMRNEQTVPTLIASMPFDKDMQTGARSKNVTSDPQVIEVADSDDLTVVTQTSNFTVCSPVFEILHEEVEEVEPTELTGHGGAETESLEPQLEEPSRGVGSSSDEVMSTAASENVDAPECELPVDWEIMPEVDRHFDEFFPTDAVDEPDDPTSYSLSPRCVKTEATDRIEYPIVEPDTIDLIPILGHHTDAVPDTSIQEPLLEVSLHGDAHSEHQEALVGNESDSSSPAVREDELTAQSVLSISNDTLLGTNATSVTNEDLAADQSPPSPSLMQVTKNLAGYLFGQMFGSARSPESGHEENDADSTITMADIDGVQVVASAVFLADPVREILGVEHSETPADCMVTVTESVPTKSEETCVEETPVPVVSVDTTSRTWAFTVDTPSEDETSVTSSTDILLEGSISVPLNEESQDISVKPQLMCGNRTDVEISSDKTPEPVPQEEKIPTLSVVSSDLPHAVEVSSSIESLVIEAKPAHSGVHSQLIPTNPEQTSPDIASAFADGTRSDQNTEPTSLTDEISALVPVSSESESSSVELLVTDSKSTLSESQLILAETEPTAPEVTSAFVAETSIQKTPEPMQVVDEVPLMVAVVPAQDEKSSPSSKKILVNEEKATALNDESQPFATVLESITPEVTYASEVLLMAADSDDSPSKETPPNEQKQTVLGNESPIISMGLESTAQEVTSESVPEDKIVKTPDSDNESPLISMQLESTAPEVTSESVEEDNIVKKTDSDNESPLISMQLESTAPEVTSESVEEDNIVKKTDSDNESPLISMQLESTTPEVTSASVAEDNTVNTPEPMEISASRDKLTSSDDESQRVSPVMESIEPDLMITFVAETSIEKTAEPMPVVDEVSLMAAVSSDLPIENTNFIASSNEIGPNEEKQLPSVEETRLIPAEPEIPTPEVIPTFITQTNEESSEPMPLVGKVSLMATDLGDTSSYDLSSITSSKDIPEKEEKPTDDESTPIEELITSKVTSASVAETNIAKTPEPNPPDGKVLLVAAVSEDLPVFNNKPQTSPSKEIPSEEKMTPSNEESQLISSAPKSVAPEVTSIFVAETSTDEPPESMPMVDVISSMATVSDDLLVGDESATQSSVELLLPIIESKSVSFDDESENNPISSGSELSNSENIAVAPERAVVPELKSTSEQNPIEKETVIDISNEKFRLTIPSVEVGVTESEPIPMDDEIQHTSGEEETAAPSKEVSTKSQTTPEKMPIDDETNELEADEIYEQLGELSRPTRLDMDVAALAREGQDGDQIPMFSPVTIRESPEDETSLDVAPFFALGQRILSMLPETVEKLATLELRLHDNTTQAEGSLQEIQPAHGDASEEDQLNLPRREVVTEHILHRESESPTLGENTTGPPTDETAGADAFSDTTAKLVISQQREVEKQWQQVQQLLSSRLEQLERAESTAQTSRIRFLATVTHTMVTESVEERIVQLQDNFNTLRTAISSRETVVIQRIIITIVRTVTEWLETIEYRICTIKQTKSIERKIEECKSLQEEVRVVEENLQQLEEVTELSVEVINEQTKILLHKCVKSLKQQVEVVGQVTKRGEEEIQNMKHKWDGYLSRISDEELRIKDLVSQLDSMKVADQMNSEQKLIWLEDIETSIQERLGLVGELVAAGTDLIKEIPYYNVPDDVYNLYDTIKILEGSVQEERDKLLHQAVVTAEYRETLEEFSDIVQLSNHLVESKIVAHSATEAAQEVEKRQRFLLRLRYFLLFLKGLQTNLDPFTQFQCRDLHTRLTTEAETILQLAGQQQEQMDVSLQVLHQLEGQWDAHEDWHQQFMVRIPDITSVSTDQLSLLIENLEVSS